MKLARVVGTVVSTINAPDLDDRSLLLCDLLDPSGALAGGYLIAVDSVGAGAGETVLILDEGNSARQVLGRARRTDPDRHRRDRGRRDDGAGDSCGPRGRACGGAPCTTAATTEPEDASPPRSILIGRRATAHRQPLPHPADRGIRLRS